MKKLLLSLVAAVMCVACHPPEVADRRHPDNSKGGWIYVRDAFGECYALPSGRDNYWIHMKQAACESKYLERVK